MSVRSVIKDSIQEILDNNGRTGAIEESSQLVKDLAFTSLDVAELVAVLEMELDVDPFSDGVSLMDVRTYSDFCAVYEKACQSKAR